MSKRRRANGIGPNGKLLVGTSQNGVMLVQIDKTFNVASVSPLDNKSG